MEISLFSILESVTSPVLVIGNEKRIVWLNQPAQELLEIRSHVAVNQYIEGFIQPIPIPGEEPLNELWSYTGNEIQVVFQTATGKQYDGLVDCRIIQGFPSNLSVLTCALKEAAGQANSDVSQLSNIKSPIPGRPRTAPFCFRIDVRLFLFSQGRPRWKNQDRMGSRRP